MMLEPYNTRVRELFSNTAHAGRIAAGTRVQTDDQGVRIELSAMFGKGNIEQLRYRAYGCPHLIAATEAFCAEYEGQAVCGLREFTAAKLMQSLAVPAEKSGRILVLEDAVRMLATALRESSSSTEQD